MTKKRLPKPVRDESAERIERSKKAVLATTMRLLFEVGFGGVSVDKVSKISGVAKTTIYRHWPSRSTSPQY